MTQELREALIGLEELKKYATVPLLKHYNDLDTIITFIERLPDYSEIVNIIATPKTILEKATAIESRLYGGKK